MVDSNCISFLQFALNPEYNRSRGFCTIEWNNFFELCQKHTILGVVFDGIKHFKKEELGIPKCLLLNWIAISEKNKHQNQILNQKCVEIITKLNNSGIRSCILKGQGNALMYSSPDSRTSGDIDLWVDCRPDDVIEWVRKEYPHAEYNYLHIDYPWDSLVPTEIHYRCSYLFNRKSNALFQKWVENKKEKQFSHKVTLPDDTGSLCVPTNDFNHVFQLTHMLRHFLGTGVGLRHMIDYYYLLKQGSSEKEKEDFSLLVKNLGIDNFAAAVMYVEKEILGLDESFLLVPINKRRGKILLKHIMSDGNFGHQGDNSYLFCKNPILRNVARLYRLITLVYVCPKEAISKLIYGKPKY